MLTLLLALTAAQPLTRVPPEKSPIEQYYVPPRFRWSRSDGRYAPGDAPASDVSYAFFEAFPASGAGVPAACSTTAPTGAKGEVLTFTRTGNATCSKKGLATTGIADGDLVVMSGNVARVEPDADGVLGLRVEGARTNSFLRSQEFDNAAWTRASTGAALPTITGDATTAPDGTLTAERVQFPSTTAVQFSGIQPAVNVHTAATWTDSYYVKGNGGGGTLDICMYNGAAYTCTACNYVADSWTRCTYTATGSAAGFSYVGNMSSVNGGTARSANDVYLWGAQAELGAYATSYIPTTSAAVTRNADSAAAFTISPLGPSGSLAASVQFPSTALGAVNVTAFGAAGVGNNWTLYRTSDTAAGYQIGTTTTAPAVPSMGTAVHRTALADNAGIRSAFWDATPVSAPAASLSGTQTVVWVGAGVSGGTPSNGIVSRICLDPDPTRCR